MRAFTEYGGLFTLVMFVHLDLWLSEVTFSFVCRSSRIDKTVLAQFQHSAKLETIQNEYFRLVIYKKKLKIPKYLTHNCYSNNKNQNSSLIHVSSCKKHEKNTFNSKHMKNNTAFTAIEKCWRLHFQLYESISWAAEFVQIWASVIILFVCSSKRI